ncbi:hypothetical protein CYLTODRAFT_287559 [Cylindrobasidium torrendii FP15055 ss-10]|uniref:F-box domain-containing protein n=1 Tax=Cylindrobasidium torrendii FP15055 ss-10 TaxID=1314674 RepID=A0A0D7BBJ0_9AGAR|nr:hypothetical protein CYLTODRAFT_287559 [Cylindrobasidium torrendii FP15055 ss-10]
MKKVDAVNEDTTDSQSKNKKAVSKTKHKETVDNSNVASREAVRRSRGRRGFLSTIIELPRDIIIEIFSRLHPGDLLSLARTSKDFRSIMLGDAAEYIWRTCRSKVPSLPPPPCGMSEPAYASLVFDTFCHECTIPRARYVDWLLRIRLCGDCLLIGHIYTNRPECHGRSRYDAFLISLFKHAPKIEYRGSQIEHSDFYHIKAWNRLLDEVLPMSDDKQLKEWEQKRQGMDDDAAKIRNFFKVRAAGHKDDLAIVRAERIDAIMAKLEVEWSKELTPEIREFLKNHKLVSQPRALTDRIWKNIEPPLIEILQKERDVINRRYRMWE